MAAAATCVQACWRDLLEHRRRVSLRRAEAAAATTIQSTWRAHERRRMEAAARAAAARSVQRAWRSARTRARARREREEQRARRETERAAAAAAMRVAEEIGAATKLQMAARALLGRRRRARGAAAMRIQRWWRARRVAAAAAAAAAAKRAAAVAVLAPRMAPPPPLALRAASLTVSTFKENVARPISARNAVGQEIVRTHTLETFDDDSLLARSGLRQRPADQLHVSPHTHTTTQTLAPLALPKVIFSKKPVATTATEGMGLLKGGLDAPPGAPLRPPGKLAPVVRAGGFRPPSAHKNISSRPPSAARRGASDGEPDARGRVSCRRMGAATWRRAPEVASQERELRSTCTGESGVGGWRGSSGLSTRRHSSARPVADYTSNTPQSAAAASVAPVTAARFRRTSMLS
jgi:hypothetical protein